MLHFSCGEQVHRNSKYEKGPQKEIFVETKKLKEQHNYTFHSAHVFDNENVTNEAEKELVKGDTRPLLIVQ